MLGYLMQRTNQFVVESSGSLDQKISIAYTKVAGLHIRYAEVGRDNDKKVLMIHGGGVSSGAVSWSKIMPVIGAEHHVIAPDLPGYGKSQKSREKATLAYYADFTESFMKHMHIKRADIIAESFGGGIALGFTLEHKERVNSLALIDAYGFFDKKFPLAAYLLTRIPADIQQSLIKNLAKSDAAFSAVLKILLKGHNGNGPSNGEAKIVQEYVQRRNLTEACLEFVQSEVTVHGIRSNFTNRIPELNSTGIPVLFLHGTRDGLFPIENQKKISEKINNSRFVSIDAAHQPEETNPEEVCREILALLKRAS